MLDFGQGGDFGTNFQFITRDLMKFNLLAPLRISDREEHEILI